MTETLQKQQMARMEIGQSYLIIPYRGREIKFVHPLIGPGTYIGVGKELLKRDLAIPTGEQVAFGLDEVYNSQDREFKRSIGAENIKNIMGNNFLWVGNRYIWTKQDAKNPGVYVVYDKNAEGDSAPFNLEELEDRLLGGSSERGVIFSKDREVRFASRNTFELGKQIAKDLSQSGFVIASYDIEGAERLSKVASVFVGKPYIHGVSGNNEDVQRVASLNSGRGLGGGRLGVGGDDWVGDGVGFAFGVRSGTGEASAPKILELKLLKINKKNNQSINFCSTYSN